MNEAEKFEINYAIKWLAFERAQTKTKGSDGKTLRGPLPCDVKKVRECEDINHALTSGVKTVTSTVKRPFVTTPTVDTSERLKADAKRAAETEKSRLKAMKIAMWIVEAGETHGVSQDDINQAFQQLKGIGITNE